MAPEPWELPVIGALDLAWLVGLLEGEGSFSLQFYKEGSSKSASYALPMIQLNMSDEDVVVRAGVLMGGAQQRVRSYQPRPLPNAKSTQRECTYGESSESARFTL